jgi:hypothetical protein
MIAEEATMAILNKVLRLLRVKRQRIITAKWIGWYEYKVHPPRKKPRSWSQRAYEISARGKPRVTYRITPQGMHVMSDWWRVAEKCAARSTGAS